MAFDVQAVTNDIADGILVWCGVDSPTPAETLLAEMAAASAVRTIRHYRQLAADADFESEYTPLAIEMGSYVFQKRGVDGVTAFGENGIQRSYEKGYYPPSMLATIQLPTMSG
jgi:hypothetical protein